MKHPLFLSLLLGAFLLTGCGQPSTDIQQADAESAFSGNRESTYIYTREMKKPALSEMTNREAISSGFQEERASEYTLTPENVETFTNYCLSQTSSEDYTPTPTLYTNGGSKELTRQELVAGTKIPLTGLRSAENVLNITDMQTQQIADRGRTIVDVSTLKYGWNFDYSREDSSNPSNREERVNLTKQIGGALEENERYPSNTLLITNDLLLHVYHKLFDNGLKYYEEQIARPTLATLSEKLYKQYLNLSKQEKNPELKTYYDFLTAYWAVPQIFLPSEQTIRELLSTNEWGYSENTDITDEQITTLIQQRTQTIAKTLAPAYQTLIPQIIEEILKADNFKAIDTFLASLGSEATTPDDITLYQDYTQFKPRAHYTDSSLLKTYFTAMKWLMREKFYFDDPTLTKVAMIMVATIDPADLNALNQLSEQIKNLIGADDDLTLNEMSQFLTKNTLTTADNILNVQPALIEELKKIHPQKIQSTTYTTAEVQETTEEVAKATTDGFVFFGEKFTLDSYLFDLTTAGSAELESTYKPSIQTALIVPDILENSSLANQLVKLRLGEKAESESIIEQPSEGFTQLSSYDTVKAEAQEKLAKLSNGTKDWKNREVATNVYHKRLSFLGTLLKAPLENAPYFRFDPVYQLKNLVTYLGSYTELKHDTLLYVKQAYSEMGGGGDDVCSIFVESPALPVPKGYVESEPEFLDQLIALNTETTPYFDGQYEQEKFVEFGKILEKLKTISIQQMHNETISDEDFEWIRTLYGSFESIVLPTKTIGEPTLKEMRGGLIADIFTSEGGNPLYEAIGHPALMLLMVKDVNGARVVI
ncbi:MAG: DUF3160 domain-containing protein [Candidatus Peribacteria bacterium]|jgi:hypothetical protein|nr:DUF3160 domain-containing protein [Candidatus Peribacteria bacterium]